MSNKSIYTSLIEAKNGSIIPVLYNGKTLESRYNPLQDAERKLSLISKKTNFFIIFSLGSGILASKILEQNPESKLLIIENTKDDFDFLGQISLVKKLKESKNVIFTDLDSLYKNIINQYIPSFYGSLEIIENKNWETENTENYLKAKKIIEIALSDIKKDFSVQAHFGKTWQKNIINNLKIINKTTPFEIKSDVNKTAVIVAAGPSLDTKIDFLKQNRNSIYIIATDTAFHALNKNNIFCDCAISLDGQIISSNHFMGLKNIDETLFVFDLSGNSSAAKFLIENNHRVLFTTNAHPFSNYANQFCNNSILNLDSGAGTVTIGALDLAIKMGFKNIKVIGADFAYLNNKPYTKSIYLDSLYSLKSNKLLNAEKSFCTLMFRTPLINQKNVKTTDVLNSYKNSFIEYLNNKNIEFSNSDFEYNLINQKSITFNNKINQHCNYEQLKKSFNEYVDISKIKTIFDLKNTDICLLPLISYLRNNDDIKEEVFSYYLEKAYTTIKRYF